MIVPRTDKKNLGLALWYPPFLIHRTFLSKFHTHTHAHTHQLTIIHTHTHTHQLTMIHTHTHTHTHSLTQAT